MNEIFSSTNVILVACFAFLIIMGVVVFRHNKKTLTGRYLTWLIIASAAWILVNLIANYSLNYDEKYLLLATRLAIIGPTFIPLLMVNFAVAFPDDKSKLDKKIYFFLWVITVFILSLVPTKYNISSVKIIDLKTYSSTFEPGWLYSVFMIYFFLGLLSTSCILIKKYYKNSRIVKTQIRLIVIGISLSVIFGLLANVVLPMLGFTTLINIGSASVIFFIFFTAYAILKYKLLDIKTIIAETVVYLILIIIFIELFLSRSPFEIIIRIILLLVMVYAGRILIISTRREIQQKEELELLANRLEDANAHLKELDKMKDDFLSMASHELNTPLAAIEGYLSMILEEHIGGELNPQVKEYLDRIDKSAIRLAAIVKDLLNVSRIESGRIHLIYKEVQIEDLIEAAINEIMPKVKELGHTISFKRPEQPMPKDWLDDTRITEVVLNMLGNAVKYTPGGGKIEVGVEYKEHEILVWVKDNGKGIPKDKADRVFQKFTQVDVLKDEVKGTGLGMYISQKFIELHKGKIWFESEGEGKGSIFYFSIPILKDKPFDPNEGAGPVLK